MSGHDLDAIENLGEESEPVTNGHSHDSGEAQPNYGQGRRKNSLRAKPNAKIYSVSFQDNGFIWRETTAEAANSLWGGTSFRETDGFPRLPTIAQENCLSPTIGIPGSGAVQPDDEYDDESDQDAAVDANDKTRILQKSRDRSRHLSKSLDTRRSNNYSSIGASPSSTPIVFCIHGNKFGVARCCDELIPEQQHQKHEKVSSDLTQDHPSDHGTGDQHENLGSSGELHCHGDRAGGGMDKKARNKLIIASVLCLFFMILEIAGGFLANSLAIATDAAHLLTDFASFMISLFSLWVASRPATRRMSFGWHRAEVIGATVSVLLIWVVTGILVYIAIERIINMQFELDATIMLITSGVGVLVNIIMGCTLHQHGHGHSHGGGGHGHSHGGDSGGESGRDAEAQRKENINVRAAFIHVLGDFLQSLGVFIAALIIYFYPHLVIIDPICTFIFSILVLFTTIRILKDTMNVLMEGIPKDISFNIVQETFLSVEGIVAVHNLRIWGLTTDKTALAAHLAIAPGSNAQTILREASTKIRAKYDFYEMTLQVEEFEEDMDDCNQCKPPEL